LRPVVEEGTRRRWTVAAASIGLSIVMLDSTAVPIALPSLRLELGASTAGIQWIQGAYLIALAALLVVFDRLGHVLGRERTFEVGLVAFGAGSAISATAGSVGGVIGGRAVQGVGAAALVALSLDGARLARAQVVTLAIGPVLGGIAVELVSWRLVFWLGLAAAGTLLAITGYARWGARDETAGEAVGERGARGSVSAGVAAFGLVGAYCVLMLFLPQYTELALGHSAVVSGLLVLPLTLLPVAVAPPARGLEARVGVRAVRAGGLACAALGLLIVARTAGYVPILPGLLLFGIALGAVLARRPMGASIVGGAVGGAVLVAAGGAIFREVELDRRLDGSSFDAALADGLAGAAWLLAAVLAVCALLAWLLAARRLKR
jgi:MFS family permease